MMANINVGEKDFIDVAEAACIVWRLRKYPLAHRLDKIARKINAGLSNNKYPGLPFSAHKGLRWDEVPSVLKYEKGAIE